MMRLALVLICCVFTSACSTSLSGNQVSLPDGNAGIGFDDLRYSASLHRVLVPAGRSGRIDLVNPESLEVTSITGFGTSAAFSGGHDDGPTSVDESPGFLYVTDRTLQRLFAIDKNGLTIVGQTPLMTQPDYVRFVASKNELWVTEPGAGQIEVFSIGSNGVPASTGTVIAVSNGPESIVVDEQRGRAYTHRWQSSTVAVDLTSRQIVAEWPNGCASSRGIELDRSRGFLFAVCSEGTASVLDVQHDGRILSSIARGSGFDVVGYSPKLGHLYLAGSSCACLVTLGVSATGQLSFVARDDAPGSTHCATADDVGHAWVCDQDKGRIWRMTDSNAASL